MQCGWCNASFTPHRVNQRFCCADCCVANNRAETRERRQAEQSARPVPRCPGCEQSFKPVGRQKFCCRTCAVRVGTRRRLGIKDPGLVRQCWWCRFAFKSTDGRRDYCSEHCADLGGRLENIYRMYGITREQYRDKWFEQNGTCAVCLNPEMSERNTMLAVDHDHETGRFRGLLCSHCNRAIGLLRDDPKVIDAAARYIERRT